MKLSLLLTLFFTFSTQASTILICNTNSPHPSDEIGVDIVQGAKHMRAFLFIDNGPDVPPSGWSQKVSIQDPCTSYPVVEGKKFRIEFKRPMKSGETLMGKLEAKRIFTRINREISCQVQVEVCEE